MTHQETYRGHEIRIEEAPRTADGQAAAALSAGTDKPLLQLKIDGRRIDAIEQAPGAFFTTYLPYQTFDSVVALARAVVDHTPEFVNE